MTNTPFPRAGFFVRIGAIVYDILVILAVAMFAVGLALAVSVALHNLGVWVLAAEQDHGGRLSTNWLYRLYLLTVIVGFYVMFWTRGRQTLGMKAWRLRVQNTNGQTISKRQAVIRFFASLLGLGNLWVLFSKQKLALQDKAAHCEVVRLTPEANQFKNWRKPS